MNIKEVEVALVKKIMIFGGGCWPNEFLVMKIIPMKCNITPYTKCTCLDKSE